MPNKIENIARCIEPHWYELLVFEPSIEIGIELFVTASAIVFDGTRLMVSAYEQQQLADALDASLLTPKLSDFIHHAADIRIEPVVSVKGRIVATSDPVVWGALVDAELEVGVVERMLYNYPPSGKPYPLVSGECKDWVLSSKLNERNAVNHGWHSSLHLKKGGPYASSVLPWHFAVWQNEGSKHNDQHKDPSQCARLVKQQCTVFDKGREIPMRFEDILKHARYSEVVSHTGVLKHTRMPNVKKAEK